MADGDDNGIHRVDTVPPPNGEEDAYNAATKIGSMADAMMQEKLVAANEKALREAAEKAPPSKPLAPRTSEPPPSSKSAYVFDDTPEDEATKLGPLAAPHFPFRGDAPAAEKPPVISVLPAAPVPPAFAIPEESPPVAKPSMFRRMPFLTISVGIALILTVTIFLVTR